MKHPELGPNHLLNNPARQQELMDFANYFRFHAALREIVNVLGPETLAMECPDCQNGCSGLAAEAEEALRIAREALLGMHVLPEETNEP